MDKSTIDYILDENNPLEIRLSVINAIGWKFNSDKKNSAQLLKSILKKYKTNSIENLIDIKHIDILTCYSYSLALDNYLNVDDVVILSDKISNLDPNKFYSIYINTLIKSQKYSLSFQWCNIHLVFKELRKSDYFSSKIGKKLYDKTFEYIDIYERYCPDREYDYYIDLNAENKLYNLKTSDNKLYFQTYPILKRDGKIEVFSDSGALINSNLFKSSDFVILDITNYKHGQFNIKFTDEDNQIIAVSIKK